MAFELTQHVVSATRASSTHLRPGIPFTSAAATLDCVQLPRQDKARLRLACRELKSILDPAVFDTLTLTVSNKELLKSLATGDTLIKNFVQTLNVRHVSSISSALHGKEPAKATKRYLLQAIQSLQLLRTVK